MVYASASPPPKLKSEPLLTKKPIKVIARTPHEKLDPVSRVNLSRSISIECNVKEVGMVEKSDLVFLLGYWKQILNT